MKSLAIISEYNPCHKGHAYQIEKQENFQVPILSLHLWAAILYNVESLLFWQIYKSRPCCFVRCRYCNWTSDGICHFKCRKICILCRRYLKQAKCCWLYIIRHGNDNLSIINEIAKILSDEPENYRILLKNIWVKDFPHPCRENMPYQNI